MISVDKRDLPRELFIACSGGVDSMAALDFMKRNYKVTVLYFNHETEYGNHCEDFLKYYCKEKGIDFFKTTLSEHVEKYEKGSLEEYWRNARYKWFHSFSNIGKVVTCHHLDDCVEQFMFTAIRHGEGKVIPYNNLNVIRPFRKTEKRIFQDWVTRYKVPFIEDPSNKDTTFTRNYIRHEMMPHVLKVNPGISKTVRKIILKEEEKKRNESQLLSDQH